MNLLRPASDLIRAAQQAPAQPWPRRVLSAEGWCEMVGLLDAEPTLALAGLWADATHIHALFVDEAADQPLAVSAPIEAGLYAALSPVRPGASLFERSIADLWGHEAADALDTRPWLDHGHWAQHRPLSTRPVPSGGGGEPIEMLPSLGEDLHHLRLGPVQADVCEPVHFHLTGAGETLVRFESRGGYAHKGVLTHMRGREPLAASRLAGRLSGDAVVAHTLALCRAVEAVAGVAVPARAQVVRAVMLEWERLAHHLAMFGGVCGHAGHAASADHLAIHRESVLRTAHEVWGHRMMRDVVVPGGVALDVRPGQVQALGDVLDRIEADLPDLWHWLEAPGLLDRLTGTGVTTPALVKAFACGGPVGRAAGRSFDARLLPGGMPPSLGMAMKLRTREEGDVDARLRLLLTEITDSIVLIRGLTEDMPVSALTVSLPTAKGEGFGAAESPRGTVWYWLQLDAGHIGAVFPIDPAWLHLPLLEAAMKDQSPADLPLIRRSIAFSHAGMDL